MFLPEGGSDLTLAVHNRSEGQYARLYQVHAVGDGMYSWDSLVFTPEDTWFIDSHDLIEIPISALVETLESKGLAVDTFDGYPATNGWPLTVVVGQLEGRRPNSGKS